MNKQLFEQFKASHKRLTSYYDIIEGGHEQALDGFNLGQLAAVHIYAGGLWITEQFPEEQDGVAFPFALVLCRDDYAARTLGELEPKLFDFWKSEVHDAPKHTYDDMVKRPEIYERQTLVKFLQDNDPNGEYTDDYAKADDREPLTKKECVELVNEMLGEVGIRE
jgi:hypothetical protein